MSGTWDHQANASLPTMELDELFFAWQMITSAFRSQKMFPAVKSGTLRGCRCVVKSPGETHMASPRSSSLELCGSLGGRVELS